MPAEEKAARMRRMRASIREHNVYHWAGSLIGELAKVRLEHPPTGVAPDEPVEDAAWYAPLPQGHRAAHL
jgi:trehalose-6-phosphate synthase